MSSRVWYTLDPGCVTEVYYPTIDTPQIRDLQFLFTDGETFFHDARRNFSSEIDCIPEAALGFEVRYNHDDYGQRDDGSAYGGWGTGRPWPLLTAERGHYEIAAGHDPEPYLRALENFAEGMGLIPEQIWDGLDMPSRFLFLEDPRAQPGLCCGHTQNMSSCIARWQMTRSSIESTLSMTAM